MVVGLAFMKFMETGLTAFALQLRTDQTTGTLEALLVTPARQSLVVLGSASYELLLAAVSGVLMLAIAIVGFGLDLSVSFSSLLVLVARFPLRSACSRRSASSSLRSRSPSSKSRPWSPLQRPASPSWRASTSPCRYFRGGLGHIAKALPFSWALDLLRASLLGGDPSLGKLLALDRLLHDRRPCVPGCLLPCGGSCQAQWLARAVLTPRGQSAMVL